MECTFRMINKNDRYRLIEFILAVIGANMRIFESQQNLYSYKRRLN